MKRSKEISLVLFGLGVSAMLVACGPDQYEKARRGTYRNQADCMKDWDRDDCTPGVGGMFYSPYYYPSSYPGRSFGYMGHSDYDRSSIPTTYRGADGITRSTAIKGSPSVSRGGFGSSFGGGSSSGGG